MNLFSDRPFSLVCIKWKWLYRISKVLLFFFFLFFHFSSFSLDEKLYSYWFLNRRHTDHTFVLFRSLTGTFSWITHDYRIISNQLYTSPFIHPSKRSRMLFKFLNYSQFSLFDIYFQILFLLIDTKLVIPCLWPSEPFSTILVRKRCRFKWNKIHSFFKWIIFVFQKERWRTFLFCEKSSPLNSSILMNISHFSFFFINIILFSYFTCFHRLPSVSRLLANDCSSP